MQINKTRLKKRLLELAQIGGNPKDGWTRLAFSAEDQQGRALIKRYMNEIGLYIDEDPVGNIFGRTEENREKAVIALGSHIDTVPNGGMFDGALGVISALEVVQSLKEKQDSLKVPLEVVVFANEEGSRFNTGLTGSRGLTGSLRKEELNFLDSDGISLGKAMEACGFDPARLDQAKARNGKYQAFFEIHIEQSDRLEMEGKQVGLVDTVVGQLVIECVVYGQANHSGTTVMTRRKDALVGASKVITGIQELALQMGGDFVATVGKIDAYPNSVNSIPGKVSFTVDIRDISHEKIIQGLEQVKSLLKHAVGDGNFELRVLEEQLPTILSRDLSGIAESICQRENLPYQYVPSGACHDAQVMSMITDSCLIFVPSIGGVSHCPEENVEWEDVYIAAELLYRVVEGI
ncbi:Zn-dependent hydrolase [Gracilibacillus oryzae]|uniref:Zn-dependent hydrolase n=1 Tax=Gracilibacillus oryzae TaxID=1672701 RepID=A0A7C8GTG8_9BACI|nr:Zn-dependent hydrolase [Gracilibacillus oryzae]KAB8137454.1 Zn-dependent hydrolase [Gracilibacillus oryzae]